MEYGLGIWEEGGEGLIVNAEFAQVRGMTSIRTKRWRRAEG